MEREIFFKAKRVEDAKWIEGDLIQNDKHTSIRLKTYRANNGWLTYDVHPETVCQFTGLLDKNGRLIFDKDRIKANVLANSLGSSLGVIEVDKEFECTISIEMLGIWLEGNTEDESGYMVHFDYDFCEYENTIESFEIIGNIHD